MFFGQKYHCVSKVLIANQNMLSMVISYISQQKCTMIICGLQAAKDPYICPLLYECTRNDGFNCVHKGCVCGMFHFYNILN